MRIDYRHGNVAMIEVKLADPSGKEIRGLETNCSVNFLIDEIGEYHCAYQNIPPGKYQFLVRLKGAVKGHYPFTVNPPVPQAAPPAAPVAEAPPAAAAIPVKRPAPIVRKAASVPGAHTAPPYPPMSVRLDEQGTSLLLVTIGTDGAVSDCAIDKSSGYARLDEAACRHVKQNWKWPPPQQNGEPAIMKTRVEINWQIKDAPGGAKGAAQSH
jgi:TonB family protein